MPETPDGPEYYTPSPDAAPPAVPEPPSISDAAAEWGATQGGLPQGSSPQGNPPQWNAVPATPSSSGGGAITALVLGIVGVVTGWVPFWGVLIGVAAIIFGSVALAKRQSKAMGISGIVLGAVSALMSVVVGLFIYLGATHESDDNWFSYGPAAQTTLGPESVDGGLAISEQAFGATTWDATVDWFVVVLHNPSDGSYVTPQVTVTALDASGAVLDSSVSFASLPPGDMAIAGNFFDLNGAEVASITVTAPGVELLSGAEVPVLSVTGLTDTSDDYFTTVSGTVVSSSAPLTFGAAVTVVARDQSGAIIGSAPGYVDASDQGQGGPFQAIFYEVMPQGTTYEGYAAAY